MKKLNLKTGYLETYKRGKRMKKAYGTASKHL
jgi:hypothetical protein